MDWRAYVGRAEVLGVVIGVIGTACGGGDVDVEPDGGVGSGGRTEDGNTWPVASVEVPASVIAGTEVVVDGSDSYDEDGDPLTFDWGLMGLPTGSTARYSDESAAVTSFVADMEGEFGVVLRVFDGHEQSRGIRLVFVQARYDPEDYPPVARAGVDLEVAVGTTATLDGTQSVDPEQAPIGYNWTFEERPEGSTATLDEPTGPHPTFVADVAGTYRASLRADDGRLSGPRSEVEVIAVPDPPANEPPVADAGLDQLVPLGQLVDIEGDSSDPEGSYLQFQYTLADQPAGSHLRLSAPSASNTLFTPQVPGDYRVEFVVGDGKVASEPDSVTVTASDPNPAVVPFAPLDVAYSRALDEVVLLREASVRLHDPQTHEARDVDLPAPAKGLSLSPDGTRAAIGHDGSISVVDLASGTLEARHTVDIDVGSVLFGDGYIYGFVGTGLDGGIATVDLASGAATFTDRFSVIRGPRARLAADRQTMYVATEYGLERYDVSSGPPSFVREWNVGDCGNIWLTEDGRTLVTRCGTTYRLSDDPASDMAEIGPLETPDQDRLTIYHLDHSTRTDELAVVRGVDNGLGTHEEVWLYQRDRVPRARAEFPEGETPLARYAFYSADGSSLVAVLERQDYGDSTDPGEREIVTFAL